MAVTARKTPIKYRRGKPLPVIKHGDLLDWTSFPLHSKPNGSPIERCPKCGRKGQRSRYKTHEGYTHTSRFETILWMVKDSCMVPLA